MKMVNKKGKVMEEKNYFIPCLVNESPATAVFPHELMIHYKGWKETEESWTIVQKSSVIASDSQLRGNAYNHLRPALCEVDIYEKEREYFTVRPYDIDDRLIQIEKNRVIHLTRDEAEKNLRNKDWIKDMYGLPSPKESKKISVKELGNLVVDASTGLISPK